jgi:hypothetical protein
MQQLRVETAVLQAMATRWGALAGELTKTVAHPRLGLSSQASASAVNAAQADIGSFTAELANRVDMRSSYVTDADSRCVAKDAHSADEMAAVTHSVTVV